MLKNLSITPTKTTARQAELTHRLQFDNGQEIDLAKSNFISAAKPSIRQPEFFQTPTRLGAESRYSIHSRTMMSSSRNRGGRTMEARSGFTTVV